MKRTYASLGVLPTEREYDLCIFSSVWFRNGLSSPLILEGRENRMRACMSRVNPPSLYEKSYYVFVGENADG